MTPENRFIPQKGIDVDPVGFTSEIQNQVGAPALDFLQATGMNLVTADEEELGIVRQIKDPEIRDTFMNLTLWVKSDPNNPYHNFGEQFLPKISDFEAFERVKKVIEFLSGKDSKELVRSPAQFISEETGVPMEHFFEKILQENDIPENLSDHELEVLRFLANNIGYSFIEADAECNPKSKVARFAIWKAIGWFNKEYRKDNPPNKGEIIRPDIRLHQELNLTIPEILEIWQIRSNFSELEFRWLKSMSDFQESGDLANKNQAEWRIKHQKRMARKKSQPPPISVLIKNIITKSNEIRWKK
jgi:hypothetical protein